MEFTEFVRAELPGLCRFAAVLCGRSGEAEDVVQSVLLRAQQQWSRIDATDRPGAYVRRMITNEYVSWHRKWGRIVPHGSLPEERAVPDIAAAGVERSALHTELARLPRQQRAVLVLRFYLDLSDADIAAQLGCGEGTVRSHASRALARLGVEFDDANGAPAPPPDPPTAAPFLGEPPTPAHRIVTEA